LLDFEKRNDLRCELLDGIFETLRFIEPNSLIDNWRYQSGFYFGQSKSMIKEQFD
jgi:hypothetical protein